MYTLQNSLYAIAIALCMFSTGITRRKNITGKRLSYFTWFLVIQSLVFVFELLKSHPTTTLKALWLGLLMSTSLLVAPCLWLAFNESISGVRLRLASLKWQHYAVIIVGFLLTLPLIDTANLSTGYYNPERVKSVIHSRITHTTMFLCMVLYVSQVPWYLMRCRRILLSRIQPGATHWGYLPLIVVCTTWVMGILRTLDCLLIKSPPAFGLFVAMVNVGVTAGTLYLLIEQLSAPESPAYAKSQLGSAIRIRIKRKIETVLSDDAFYRNSEVSLQSLSNALNENTHYVSQVINQDFNTTFYELINRYRVEQAKRLLRDSPDATVLSIALEVGFNSKSAFHNAFRRHAGTTPTDFRASSPIG